MKPEKHLINKSDPAYEVIGNYIHSKDSVVGIDARHTHIIIINKLLELEKKINAIEKKLDPKKKSKIKK